MFGIFTGVIVNTVTVIIGSLVGSLVKNEKLKNVGDRVFQAFAFFVIAIGVSGAAGISDPVAVILCIVIGVAIGELVDIDRQFERLSSWLQRSIKKKGKKDGAEEAVTSAEADSAAAQNVIMAICLFCIGSMTFLGAMEAAFQHTHSIYYTKSVMDMISSMTLAMGAGISIAFAAAGVFVYQGLLVLLASLLAPVLTDASIALSSQIGSIFLIAIAFNMVGVTKIKVANFLPAMFIPFFWQAIQLLFA
jgi:uncharacterized membrane protein YqgA involved in biofilm formation